MHPLLLLPSEAFLHGSATFAQQKTSAQRAPSDDGVGFEAAASKSTFQAASRPSVSPRFFAHLLPPVGPRLSKPAQRPAPALAPPGHIPRVSQTAHGQASRLTVCWPRSWSVCPSNPAPGWGGTRVLWPAISDVKNPTSSCRRWGCTEHLPASSAQYPGDLLHGGSGRGSTSQQLWHMGAL